MIFLKVLAVVLGLAFLLFGYFIRSDLPRCLGNSVFCVEKED